MHLLDFFIKCFNLGGRRSFVSLCERKVSVRGRTAEFVCVQREKRKHLEIALDCVEHLLELGAVGLRSARVMQNIPGTEHSSEPWSFVRTSARTASAVSFSLIAICNFNEICSCRSFVVKGTED